MRSPIDPETWQVRLKVKLDSVISASQTGKVAVTFFWHVLEKCMCVYIHMFFTSDKSVYHVLIYMFISLEIQYYI